MMKYLFYAMMVISVIIVLAIAIAMGVAIIGYFAW